MTTLREMELGGLATRIVSSDSQAPPRAAVVLLHGFGAPGTDLVGLSEVLPRPPGTVHVYPAAPVDLAASAPGFAFGGDARAWWMIDVAALEYAIVTGRPRRFADEVPEGLAEARRHVVGLLDALPGALGGPLDRLVIGGFSQGAMLACDVALRDDRGLAGLVLLSGNLLARGEWSPRMGTRRGLPVFQSHGESDALLPFDGAVQLRDELRAAGADVTWVPFPGGHEIPAQVLAQLQRYLTTVLGS